MTTEERFAQIEHRLTILVDVHERNQETLGQLMRLVDTQITSSAARMTRLQDAIEQTNETVQRFADSSDARMRRIEDNLDALIRAITADHTNGKTHEPRS